MSGRFDITDTSLSGVKVLQRKPVGDSRGYLERLFCGQDLAALFDGKQVVQINRTLTVKRGTVRGLHLQLPPHDETKLITCLRGEVFDVAVDVRRGSATFLRWHAEVLTADNHRSLVIPSGYAHGFQTLTDDCELLYLHTAAYRADAEAGADALDPRIAIQWPLPIAERSARDQAHPPLGQGFSGFEA
jgi:dTDP-4-dehydrorhamnose 3,5-epimerase